MRSTIPTDSAPPGPKKVTNCQRGRARDLVVRTFAMVIDKWPVGTDSFPAFFRSPAIPNLTSAHFVGRIAVLEFARKVTRRVGCFVRQAPQGLAVDTKPFRRSASDWRTDLT